MIICLSFSFNHILILFYPNVELVAGYLFEIGMSNWERRTGN